MKKKLKEARAERIKKVEEHIELGIEKDRKRIAQFRKEHKRFSLFLYTIILHIKLFIRKNTADNINAMSGQSAFFLILSIVPLLLLVFTIVTMLGGKPDAATLEKVASQSSEIANATQSISSMTVQDFFRRFILETYQHATSGVIVITAVIALWSGGKGLYIITDGISRIYRIPQKHIWILRRVFAMGYTLVLLLMMFVSFALLIVSVMFDEYLRQAINGIPLTAEILFALRYIIATVIMALFLTIALKLYLRGKVEDKRYVKFRVLLPGMIFTAIAWNLLARGVSLYATYFTSSMYGSLGAVFIYMMWIYFMMLLLLYGVQINYLYREQFYRFSFKKLFGAIRKKRSDNKKKAA